MTLRRETRRRFLASLAALAVFGAARPLRAEPGRLPGGLRLLFVEDAACGYCRKWLSEIGGSYDETPPGKAAPLVRRTMGDPSLSGLAGLRFTPTFVLLRDGREIDRMVGYGGMDEFWEGLAGMLAKAEIGKEPPGRSAPGQAPPDDA